MRDSSQMLLARRHDDPRVGTPASIKPDVRGPFEILHGQHERMVLECLTRKVD
jgi:hypothetical protein